jgi:hypothetical protein
LKSVVFKINKKKKAKQAVNDSTTPSILNDKEQSIILKQLIMRCRMGGRTEWFSQDIWIFLVVGLGWDGWPISAAVAVTSGLHGPWKSSRRSDNVGLGSPPFLYYKFSSCHFLKWMLMLRFGFFFGQIHLISRNVWEKKKLQEICLFSLALCL